MSKRFLFSYAFLASSFLSFPLLAECIPSPDCATLGYNKSDTGCNGAPFVRCPFDISKVACVVSVSCSDSKDNLLSDCPSDWVCTTQNFGGNVCYKKLRIKTCEEKGQKTCNGICISSEQCCTDADCNSGYTCNSSSRTCEENKTCAIGDIYYSDKTCSTDLASGKTPIGVVGYITNGGKNGIVVEKNHSSSTMPWGCQETDLSCIVNMPGTDGGSNPELKADYNGKANTACIVQNNCSYNGVTGAGVYCNNRIVEGITGWYLPAGGELNETMIENNTTVNIGLEKISNSQVIPIAGEKHSYWSSSEYNNGYAWRWTFTNDHWYSGSKYDNRLVRCVLAF